MKGALSPMYAARGRVLATVLAAGPKGATVEQLVLGPDSRRAVGALIGDGLLLMCADRVRVRGRAPAPVAVQVRK